MIEKFSYDVLENMTDEELNQLKEKYTQERENLKSYHDNYQYVDNMLSRIHNEKRNRNIRDNVGRCFKDGTLYIYFCDVDIGFDFYQACCAYKSIVVCADKYDLSIMIDIINSSEIKSYQSITKEEFDEVYKNVATKLFALTKGENK